MPLRFRDRATYCLVMTTMGVRWTDDPANYRNAIAVLAFEAYHMRLFLRLCRQGLSERIKRGSEYPRAFCDQAFESSFYVHLRVLVAVFYMPPKYDDDVAYSDFQGFFQQPFTPAPLDTSDPKAEQLRTNLNKRVAHLSSCRFQEPQPQSTDERQDELEFYLKYGDRMDSVLTAFVENLTGDLQETFRARCSKFATRDDSLLHSGQLPKHFVLQRGSS